jgi:hypothetical protein
MSHRTARMGIRSILKLFRETLYSLSLATVPREQVRRAGGIYP